MTDPDTLEAAKCLWLGMRELHKAGSLLATRHHESIDQMESELYDMVGGYSDCPECDTPTPTVLLAEPGQHGVCPMCQSRHLDLKPDP